MNIEGAPASRGRALPLILRSKLAVGVIAIAIASGSGVVVASAGNDDNGGPVATDKGGEVQAGFANKVMWAVVDANGTLARHDQGVSVTHIAGQDHYVVAFDRDIRACSYTATIGLSGSTGESSRGFVTVVGALSNNNAVFVKTRNSADASAERGFHLQVLC